MPFLTLEDLDQFGSLDELPFSLDNNWTADGVCGPYSLELLDQFGNLDDLAFSLDSTVWETQCIYLAEGSISGTGTLEATPDAGFIVYEGEAHISASGTLTATADFVPPVEAAASIFAVGSLIADATRIQDSEAVITASGSLTAGANKVKDGQAAISGTADVTIGTVTRIRQPLTRPAKTLTVSGTLTTSTAQKKFGAGSMYSASQLNKLDIQPYGDFSGFGDAGAEWTIEVWFYQTATNSAPLLEIRNSSGLRLLHCYAGSHPASGNLCLYLTWNDVVTYNQNTAGTPTFSLNTWNHLVLRKQANKAPQFIVNGTVFPSTPVSYSGTVRDWSTINNVKSIGWATINIALAGYADELRVSSVDRYPTYTTPTAAFVNDPNTILLIHGDTDISDDITGPSVVYTGTSDVAVDLTRTRDGAGSIFGEGNLESGTAFELQASASLSGVASVASGATRERYGQGIITAEGTLSSEAFRERDGAADVSAEGVISAGANVTAEVTPGFSGIGTLDSSTNVTVVTDAQLSGTADLEAETRLIPAIFITFSGSGLVAASVYKYGQEWGGVQDKANTWSEVVPESALWQTVQSGTNTWQRLG